ncbi:hypothetical protein WOLCODRAFT_94664 [Wolfiporia cocos MD-104 SS10]|uniref:N-acetyltransferase domain-containing protein n=1 Tax=Wolfiporia cocos (strain MD-104) TaxID=742152 RepID=A0A2H3J2M2_WOLCO|nr:hypothetical protein WOLCODRAFT_94664 [Wolfiporia cocos MD-104 SS10]
MYHSQLHPLQIDPTTGEPFLRLPAPLQNIIITPPRLSDGASIVPILNDNAVCRWLQGPPYPYLPSHAESWLAAAKNDSDVILNELERASKDGPLKIIDACPVRILRETNANGPDTFLGDIFLHRCQYPYEEPTTKQELSAENARKEVGDPTIVWCIGDYLASSHHGRGIMSTALKTLLTAWAIPRMGVRRIRAETFRGNVGSVRVFEKNGFVLEKTVDHGEVTTSGKRIDGAHILWWEYK